MIITANSFSIEKGHKFLLEYLVSDYLLRFLYHHIWNTVLISCLRNPTPIL